jgi:cell division septation protein DedD
VTRARLIGALLVVAVALPLAGCGSSGRKIPKQDSSDIIARLDEADRRSDPLRCDDLRKDTIPALEQQIAALPHKTSKDIRDTLQEGVDNLRNLVAAKCSTQQEKPKEPTTTESTQTEPTTTESAPPTTTETTPSTNTQPPTTNTTPTETTPTGPSGGAPPGQQKKPKKSKEGKK